MRMARPLGSLLVAASVLAAVGTAAAQPKVSGGMLTDESGMTLYVFDNDATVPGKSSCTGPCLNMWTPLYALPQAKAQGDCTLISRDDGKLQWTYKGKPLYRWYADKKPGDKDSDGLRRVWHVAVP